MKASNWTRKGKGPLVPVTSKLTAHLGSLLTGPPHIKIVLDKDDGSSMVIQMTWAEWDQLKESKL